MRAPVLKPMRSVLTTKARIDMASLNQAKYAAEALIYGDWVEPGNRNRAKRRWEESIDDHIGEKHRDLHALLDWRRANPLQAQRHEQGYGLLSYFAPDKWGDRAHVVSSLMAEALNNPTSVHAAAGDSNRAILLS
jgi:hypothetical protein